jgi:hypothetical protein
LNRKVYFQKDGDSVIRSLDKVVDKGTLTGAAADAFFTFQFYLSDLPEYASMTTLFDQYRITKIELYFEPLCNRVYANGAANQVSGLLATSIDYDDNGTPGSLAVVLNYENVCLTPAGEKHLVAFRPHAAISAYGGGVFGNYANVASPWIDAASPNVVHYGVKYALDIGNAGELMAWDLVVSTVFQFRASR